MAHVSQPRPATRRQPAVWPRRIRRPWLRSGDLAAAGILFAAIPSLPRPVLARLAEQIINRMDDLDGDPDVEANGDELDVGLPEGALLTGLLGGAALFSEDAEEDDTGGGSVDDEGEPDPWRDTLATMDLPQYGKDQRLGPTNVASAHAKLLRAYARYDHVTPPVAAAIIAAHKEQAHE